MKRLSNSLRLVSVLLIVTLLAACAPGEQPPSQEDIDAAVNTAVAQAMDAQDEVSTSVAMTVAAQNTQTAAAIPTQTDTPTASVFESAPIITDTPLVTVTPSPTFPPPPTDPPVATVTVPKYKCDAYTQSPKNRDEARPGENFRIKFIIVNTGTKALPAGVDVKYSGGTKMTSVTFVEIPNALQPSERYTIVLDGVAPNEQGLHYMTWTVEGALCSAFFSIEVK